MNYLADLNGTVLGRFAQQLQSVRCLKTSGGAGGERCVATVAYFVCIYNVIYIIFNNIIISIIYAINPKRTGLECYKSRSYI